MRPIHALLAATVVLPGCAGKAPATPRATQFQEWIETATLGARPVSVQVRDVRDSSSARASLVIRVQPDSAPAAALRAAADELHEQYRARAERQGAKYMSIGMQYGAGAARQQRSYVYRLSPVTRSWTLLSTAHSGDETS